MLRSIARGMAKKNLKRAGYAHFCKHSSGQNSWFSEHWREWVKVSGRRKKV